MWVKVIYFGEREKSIENRQMEEETTRSVRRRRGLYRPPTFRPIRLVHFFSPGRSRRKCDPANQNERIHQYCDWPTLPAAMLPTGDRLSPVLHRGPNSEPSRLSACSQHIEEIRCRTNKRIASLPPTRGFSQSGGGGGECRDPIG